MTKRAHKPQGQTRQSQLCFQALSLQQPASRKHTKSKGKTNKSLNRQLQGKLSEAARVCSRPLVSPSQHLPQHPGAAEPRAPLLLWASTFSALILWAFKYIHPDTHPKLNLHRANLSCFFFSGSFLLPPFCLLASSSHTVLQYLLHLQPRFPFQNCHH